MNKNILFVSIGVLSLGGLAYWFFTKKNGVNNLDTSSLEKSTIPTNQETYSDTGTSVDIGAGLGASKYRKQTRRDCRAEAKAQGLRGKAKRQFKRSCKAAGGINADTADFAFNGYDGSFEFA